MCVYVLVNMQMYAHVYVRMHIQNMYVYVFR
jgi:hypothetical protein